MLFFFFCYLRCGKGFFFFFQAEDGIRDPLVTGVQTCALPICSLVRAVCRPDVASLCACAHGPGAKRRAINHSREGSMADLTEQQKQEYWRYNVQLTTILLVIWFVVTYIISGLMAGWLNEFSFLGFPLGYYMAAQGSLAIFVVEIAVYARLMNKKDEQYGIREEG